MNIEEAKILLNWQLECADEENKKALNLFDKEAIRTLLTAYEEKGEECDFLDKELYNANQEIQDLQLNIEKQSKEIEELKEDNKHQWEERCKLTFELENSTSNDKIKAKIEEYEKMKEATKMDTTYYGEKRRSVIEGLIVELQSLLEKE